ncbi:MAG: glutamine-hydrolyzing carbamoyl-phosphate synthase small subunit [Bacteroides sp.]|nr:MAG: glutamine-hydrolyzing carbamoyl-phosphate synthase small subunit [Bacteroides sp.]
MQDFHKKDSALLMLEDGTILYGKGGGAKGISTGELCFNTGLTGYQEIFTDPSYFGQILVTTHIHIGNYGTINSDNESNNVNISGLICKKYEKMCFRNKTDLSLDEFLIHNNIIVIHDIDTRNLVKIIRNKGAMNCLIAYGIQLNLPLYKKMLNSIPKMEGQELASKITTKSIYYYGNIKSEYRVAVLDLGIKNSILKNLSNNDIYMKVFPAKSSFEEMEKWNPDGYFISNGPGDPSSMEYAIKNVTKIINSNKVVFGICLGYQLIALSMGIKTYKMCNGHRGVNHPVKNLENGLSEITTQNHGFAIDYESAISNKNCIITHINLNDNTIEGFKIKNKPVFSVQYHPESSPGPNDSLYLFKQFLNLLKINKKNNII